MDFNTYYMPSCFSVGDRVIHMTYGNGTVVGINEDFITVDFDTNERHYFFNLHGVESVIVKDNGLDDNGLYDFESSDIDVLIT